MVDGFVDGAVSGNGKEGDFAEGELKSTMATITLDHIDNIQFDPQSSPIPNPHALFYLSHGLGILAGYVRKQEIKIIEKHGGNPPLIIALNDSEINPLLHSTFNWFATDLVNYIRLIGFIDGLQKGGLKYKDISYNGPESARKEISVKLNDHCTNYIKKVHPEILLWRNKVSSHIALIAPRKEDNLGTLESSVMFLVSYSRPYFEAGGFKWVIGEDESQLPAWNLTKLFEDLRPRYWPGKKLSDFLHG